MMNKSHRKFSVGDLVFVKTANKYGLIKDVSKTPSGRTAYLLDIDYLVHFDEEFEPTSEYELVGKKFVDHVTDYGKKLVSTFALLYNEDGTFDLVVCLVEDPAKVEDEDAETYLIKMVAELAEQDVDVVRREQTPDSVTWTLKKPDNEFSIDSILNSTSAEAEIVSLESLMNHYLEQLHKAKTEQEKEQIKQMLADIVDRLKQLEYF